MIQLHVEIVKMSALSHRAHRVQDVPTSVPTDIVVFEQWDIHGNTWLCVETVGRLTTVKMQKLMSNLHVIWNGLSKHLYSTGNCCADFVMMMTPQCETEMQ